jgi:hypothetical protein
MVVQESHADCPVNAVHEAILDIVCHIEIDILINLLIIQVVQVDFEHFQETESQHVLFLDDRTS